MVRSALAAGGGCGARAHAHAAAAAAAAVAEGRWRARGQGRDTAAVAAAMGKPGKVDLRSEARALGATGKLARRGKSGKARRALAAREPQMVEGPKATLLFQGTKVSQVTKDVLSEIHRLKKVGGDVQRLTKPNELHPFESESASSLEFLCERADAGIFVMASHSKKREHNLTLGRIYDGRVYDMLEVGVSAYTKLGLSKYAANASAAGQKPCFVFLGDEFDLSAPHATLRSMLLDMFRGRVVNEVNLKALDSCWVCAAPPGKQVHLHLCKVRLKKGAAGSRVPRVELERMGPTFELELRRHQPAAADVAKEAVVKTAVAVEKKRKNVKGDLLEGTLGKVYVPRQSVDDMVQTTYKMKGMRSKKDRAAVGKAIAEDTDVDAS